MTSPMKPAVTSWPVACDSKSQPSTMTIIATMPMTTFCQEVQRSAR